jgi:hypothetical protein
MRSLSLFALLAVFALPSLAATVDASGTAAEQNTAAEQRRQELAQRAMLASRSVDEFPYLVGLLQPMPSSKLHVRDMRPFVLPGEGWLAITDNGIWSVGNESSLYIVIGANESPRKLLMQGTYFQGKEPTRLFVNGQLLSETNLRDHTVELPPDVAESPVLHIKLQHLNPLSRNDVDPNHKSTHKIKFQLEQIRVW